MPCVLQMQIVHLAIGGRQLCLTFKQPVLGGVQPTQRLLVSLSLGLRKASSLLD